jgi:hypothetical protein
MSEPIVNDGATTDPREREVAERIEAWYAAPLAPDRGHRDRVIDAALESGSGRARRRSRGAVAWVAAGCAAVLTVGVLLGRWRSLGESSAVAPVSVRFVLRGAPTATRVAVVGDFNGWDVVATPLFRVASGAVWTVDVRMPPGRYGYAFVVDGRQWVADPTAPLAPDAFGTPTSVIIVGTGGAT